MLQNHQEFIDECLREHNRFRQNHSAKPLRKSLNLEKSAQEWAEDLLNQQNLHNSPLSGRGEVGENISMRSSSAVKVTLTGADVCRQWYKDIKYYDFEKGTGPAGNFTQMVWDGTDEVGFGIAHGKGRCVVVAHYKPAGNVRGKYQANVHAVKSDGDVDKEKDLTDSVSSIKLDSSSTQQQPSNHILEVFRMPQSHARTSSMSSDEHFEQELNETPEINKPEARRQRQFIREAVTQINKHRAKHNVDKLVHCKILSQRAQEWAEILADKSTLSNSNNSYQGDRVGESIATKWSNASADYEPNEVIDKWYNENSKYSYDKEPQNVQGIGNFTQMVWSGTKMVGIGKAYRYKDNNKRVVVVCNYYPPGNVLTKFRGNVSKPL